MIPIHELLARIRWDPEFGRGRFEIAYLDKREGRRNGEVIWTRPMRAPPARR